MEGSRLLARLAAHRRSYLDRYRADCASPAEFDHLREQLSLAETVPYPKTSILGVVSFVLLIGLWSYGATKGRTARSLLGIVWVTSQYAVVLGGLYWADRRYWHTVHRLSAAFADETTYYRYICNLTQRVYESNPLSSGPTGHRIHYPTVVSALGLAAIGYYWLFPTLPLPFALTPFTPMWWFFLANLAVLGYLAILLGWAMIVGLFFLGYHIGEHSDLRIRIDVTKRVDRLGLKPYGTFLTKVTLLSLLNLVIITGFILLTDPTHPFALLLPVQSLIVLVPFFGYQYGLYKLVRRSKREQMHHLRATREEQFRRWFDGPVSPQHDPKEIEPVLTIKREIDDLPEWPTDVNSVVTVLVASIIPTLLNILVTLA